MILRHFIAKDAYTENHAYRVSVYAATIAAELELPPGAIEDVRSAALLHDIGKLDISRELLYKAARLTEDEYKQMQEHVNKGVGDPRAGRRLAAPRHPDRAGAPRQVRRLGLQPDQGRGHPARGAHHLGGRRLRLAHERSPVSQGDVDLRRQGHHRQGIGNRLRSDASSTRSSRPSARASSKFRRSSSENAASSPDRSR